MRLGTDNFFMLISLTKSGIKKFSLEHNHNGYTNPSAILYSSYHKKNSMVEHKCDGFATFKRERNFGNGKSYVRLIPLSKKKLQFSSYMTNTLYDYLLFFITEESATRAALQLALPGVDSDRYHYNPWETAPAPLHNFQASPGDLNL